MTSVLLDVLALLCGAAALALSSDVFVRASARLASGLGISPLVVGTLVIGFGTSLPELFTSGLAAGQGSMGVALGSVVGSDTVNTTLILGVAALMVSPRITSRMLAREAPMAAGAICVFAVFIQDGFSRFEAVVLLVLLAVAIALVLHECNQCNQLPAGDQVGRNTEHFVGPQPRSTWRQTSVTLGGLAGTLAGAEAFIWGALHLASHFHLSQGPVGLVLVALGTSLPELAATIQGCRRGEVDLVLGNVVGSNMFNSLGVAGLAGIIHPGRVPGSVSSWPTLALVGSAVLVLGFMASGQRLRRAEGVGMLGLYGLSLWLALS